MLACGGPRVAWSAEGMLAAIYRQKSLGARFAART
jgi:hypothetical protein